MVIIRYMISRKTNLLNSGMKIGISFGRFYKIVDVGLSLCYIGSTCAMLSKRMERHGADYKIYVGGKKHFTFLLVCTRYLMNMEKKIVS